MEPGSGSSLLVIGQSSLVIGEMVTESDGLVVAVPNDQ